MLLFTKANILVDFLPSISEKVLEDLPHTLLQFGIKTVLAIIIFIVGIRVIKFIRKILKKSLMKTNADIGVTQFLDSFIKIILYILLLMVIATGFGFNVTSMIAVLGSAGVAIGLALQGSLSNLAGGVLILILKPFKVGDYIVEDSAKNEGTVSEIQIFYTKLRTSDNRIIILPNGSLANTSLTNVTESPDRRLDLIVGISYDSDLKKAKEVLQNLLDEDEYVLHDKEKKVYVDLLDQSSVNIGIRCWFKREDYWEGKWRLTENIKYLMDENGIMIPYNQLDVHLVQ